jgi:hypothetical protein
VDPATLTEIQKLNLRGGPGENYSVIGTMEALVKEVPVKATGWKLKHRLALMPSGRAILETGTGRTC